MVEAVGRRDRRFALWLVALVVLADVALVAFGPTLVRSVLGVTSQPFDLRTVGVACPDEQAWVCGSIQVPLDRRSPRGPSISVHFRVLPRVLIARATAGTVVVVRGGPGEPAMSDYAQVEKIFRSLHADHDLLLVDNRGTGESDAINCPELQQGLSSAAITECRTILGSRADDYGTVAAVDDLQDVLSRIHATSVDMYGESYGTFFAQVFALRHPQHLERLVLDGALPLAVDPWRRAQLPAALADLRTVCQADATCSRSGDPVNLLGQALPIIRLGTQVVHTSLASAADLAVLLEEAGHDGLAYRELPAALRAMLNSDPAPLMRLLDEARVGGADAASPTPTSPSWGLFVAVTCADYPHPFDLRSPLAVQQQQLNGAYRHLVAANRDTFLPFTPEELLPRTDASQCLGWPAPSSPLPASLKGPFPNIPTLVLEGGLDTVTAPPMAHAVANEFHQSHYVEVPFVGHVTAAPEVTREIGLTTPTAREFPRHGATNLRPLTTWVLRAAGDSLAREYRHPMELIVSFIVGGVCGAAAVVRSNRHGPWKRRWNLKRMPPRA
jgi:pimeloyl-ACP methyl ester carboxylesterase